MPTLTLQARAMAASRKTDKRSSKGLGSLRRTFHTTILIDSILVGNHSPAQPHANEYVGQTLNSPFLIGTPGVFRVASILPGQYFTAKVPPEGKPFL
jgi:hypothetical protein